MFKLICFLLALALVPQLVLARHTAIQRNAQPSCISIPALVPARPKVAVQGMLLTMSSRCALGVLIVRVTCSGKP